MTPQQTFNKVVKHLRKQGKKALLDGECVYRSPDGCKCAAGCLIPNKDYRKSMEGKGVYKDAKNTVCNLLRKLGHDLGLVGELQMIHDHDFVRDWEVNFRALAEDRCLVYVKATNV